MKLALILRGVTGSGKTTLVEKLKEIILDKEISVHSTDSFFMKDGEYVFDPSKLGEYHQANMESFQKSVSKGTDIVILDNTCTKNWEYEKYAQFAKDNNYIVVAIRFAPGSIEDHLSRNSHGVPKEIIERMILNINEDLTSPLVDVQHNINANKGKFEYWISNVAEMIKMNL